MADRLASRSPDIEALFARRLNYATAVALTALTVFVLGLIVIGLGRERHGADFGGEIKVPNLQPENHM